MNRKTRSSFQWPKLPSQWPALLYCMSIMCLSVAALLSHTSISDYICQIGETTAVCSRNWFSVAGNFFTGSIALIAALFAYNQYVANARQADISTVPYIEKNISDLKRVHALVANAIRAQILLQGNINNFFFLLDAGPEESILRERAKPIQEFRKSLEEVKASVFEASADLSLSREIRELAEDQAENCAVRTHDSLQMLHYIERFAEAKIGLRSSDMILAIDHAGRARPEMQAKLAKLRNAAVRLIGMVEKSQAEKDRVLSGETT